jgi:isopentenyl diphosphate isomerase/L-lactate dehydrogenase-like FMN-dependent dehydrogenase
MMEDMNNVSANDRYILATAVGGAGLKGRNGSAPVRRRRAAFSPQGDLALARAAHKAGIPFALSTASNMSIEEIAHGVNGDLRFQLYVGIVIWRRASCVAHAWPANRR